MDAQGTEMKKDRVENTNNQQPKQKFHKNQRGLDWRSSK